MTVGGGFRRVARILRHIEREGWRIESVATQSGYELWSGEGIRLRIGCTLHDTGEKLPTDCPMSLAEDLTDFSSCHARLDRVNETDAGGLSVAYDIIVESPDSREADRDIPSVDETTPLHRDRSRLARLYRQEGSFTAMADAVEEDVSPETIRRYTIEHDIHSPEGSTIRRNGPDDHAEDGTAPAGDLDIDPEVVITTVERSHTLYDVQRSLDLNRDETVALLRRYDVLDLVVGRLDRAEDVDGRREIIRQRLRDATRTDQPVVAGRNG